MIDSKTYDLLKIIQQVWLPFLTAVLTGVCGVFDLPYAVYVAGLLTVADTALGILVNYFKKIYDATEADVAIQVADTSEDETVSVDEAQG